jgi:hypothetical protein
MHAIIKTFRNVITAIVSSEFIAQTIAAIVEANKGGFPVLARSSSQLAASACMSTFIQSQC